MLNYTSKEWDFVQGVMVNSSGTATLVLNCKGNNVTVTLDFTKLTIAPVVQGTGKVIVGSVVYPPGPPPPPIELSIAGFKLLIDSFVLEPAGATAMARLEFPNTIVDVDPTAECHPARIDLGQIDFNPLCQYFWVFDQTFGPWGIGQTTLEISGTGLVVDLSTTQAATSPPYPNLPALWQGAILAQGGTSSQSSVF